MSIKIDTTEYEATHGKTPRGHGNWAFEMSAPGHGNRTDTWCCLNKYGRAKSSALAEAREKGWTAIKVLP